MRLFDLTELPDVLDEDIQEIISDRSRNLIQNAPESSRLKRELTACDRLFKMFNDDAAIVIALFSFKRSAILGSLLDKDGGEDSPEYKREDTILLDLINTYKLNTGVSVPQTVAASPVSIPTQPIPVGNGVS